MDLFVAHPLSKPGARPGRTGDSASRLFKRGFSLLEVIMATAVLTLGLGTAIIGLQVGMRDLDLARTSTAVSQALQNEAERLRMMRWTDIEALPASETIDQTAAFSAEDILKGRLTMTSGLANMKEIVLQAVWKGVDGKSHTRVYRMRYGKGGLHDYYYSSGAS
jgi:prepilin-type N-terminal cleavage/methylation domain-containing protein